MKKLILIIGLLLSIFVNAQTPDFHFNGVVLGSFVSDPVTAFEGQIYWNNVSKKFRGFDGTIWIDISSNTLQQAYDNSSEPEILTNSILEALSIKRGSASDTDDVFEILSGSDSKVFSVTGEGNLDVTGNITNTGEIKGETIRINSNGTAASPSLRWGADNSSGLYRGASGGIGLSFNGVEIFDVNSLGKTTTANLDITSLAFNNTSASVLVQNEVLGVELVVNGGFDTDTDWTKGGGATISGGKGNIIGDGSLFGSLSQSVFTIGKDYIVTIEAVINSGLGLKIQSASNNENIGVITTTGTFIFLHTAIDPDLTIARRTGGTPYDSTIDNVSVKEVISSTNEIQKRVLGSAAFQDLDKSTLVPYTGADKPIDLGSQNIATTGTVSGSTFIVTNTDSNTIYGLDALSVNTGSNNTAIGNSSLKNNSGGDSNTALGINSLISNISGNNNVAIGILSLDDNTTGSNNTTVGNSSMAENISGSENIAVGANAGQFLANGTSPNTITNNSVFIGSATKANANSETNQIVIGYNVTGNGSNTATYGNSSITDNFFEGNITTTGTIEGLTGITNKVASYTLALTDVSDMVVFNSGSALNVTIPTNASVAFIIGTKIETHNLGAGTLTILSAGVTISTTLSTTIFTDESRTFVKILTDTWVIRN